LAALPPENRTKELAKLRDEDRRRKRLLNSTLTKGPAVGPREGKYDRKVKPAHLYQYPPDVVDFVYAHIIPRLTQDELHELWDRADGKVTALAALLVQYAEKYPVLPPLPGKDGPTDRQKLPPEVQAKLPSGKGFDKGAKAALQKKYQREVEPHHG